MMSSLMTSIIWGMPFLSVLASATEQRSGKTRQLGDGHPILALTTPLYGSIGNEAYYYINIFVGNPPQKQSVILDTGSSILAFPCATCKSCGKHVNDPYMFSKSLTGRWLDCRDDICYSDRCSKDDLMNPPMDHCDYYQSYSEGSSISGHYFSDLISLTAFSLGSTTHNGSVNFEKQLTSRYDHIGCHNIETKLFVGQLANGILGVAFPHKKQPTALDALFNASTRYQDGMKTEDTPARIFSLCIAEQGGILTIGGFDPSYAETKSNRRMLDRLSRDQSLVYAHQRRALNDMPSAMSPRRDSLSLFLNDHDGLSDLMIATKITSNKAYNIGARTLFLVDNSTPDASGNPNLIPLKGKFASTMVDSGTTYSYLPPTLFESFQATIEKHCLQSTICLPPSSQTNFEYCLQTNAKSQEDALEILNHNLPTFALKMEDDAIIPWEPRSYMYAKQDRKNTWCLAVDNNHMQETVLGMSFIKNRIAVFDRENMQFTVIPGECPIVTDKTRDRQKGPNLDDPSVGNPPAIKISKDEQGTAPAALDFAFIQVQRPKLSSVFEGYHRAKDYLGIEERTFLISFAGCILLGTSMGVGRCLWIRSRRTGYTPQADGDIRGTELTSQEAPLTTPPRGSTQRAGNSRGITTL